MKTKTICQSITIQSTPKLVYEALIDSKKHAAFTGAKARITRKNGGNFSCHDGYITGVTVHLEPGTRIVQAWKTLNWPKATYSIVTFKLTKAGRGKTMLEFTQIGVPADDYEAKVNGWKEHYWAPLKAMLEKE